MAQPRRALNDDLTTLKDESRTWDEETFITGIRKFTAIARRHETLWLGPHYPSQIEELWRQTHPHLSGAAMENFDWVCPPIWSYIFDNATCTHISRHRAA